MLKVNDVDYKIKSKEIKINKSTIQFDKGYSLNILIEYNKKSYINISVGFENHNNIVNFLNKQYIGYMFSENNNDINDFEIYDEKLDKFYDTEIESNIMVNIGGIKDNKIPININLNDELIKVEISDIFIF